MWYLNMRLLIGVSAQTQLMQHATMTVYDSIRSNAPNAAVHDMSEPCYRLFAGLWNATQHIDRVAA